MSDDNDLEVYIFRGNEGEEVPKSVAKLIVNQGVQVLPEELCHSFDYLQEVTLPSGLIKIGNAVFGWCTNLLEINNCNTLKSIGEKAFLGCRSLTKVEFESSTTSSPHQLETIDLEAFRQCLRLSRMKLPPSVSSVGEYAFYYCESLIEANLSTTGLTEISDCTFCYCLSLQTACLPNTLERICFLAFKRCVELVTVVVPLDAQHPIKIGKRSFVGCKRLANVVFPRDSTAEEDSFAACEKLHERYGKDGSCVVAGLIKRFENFPIHRMCYDDNSGATVEELRHQCHQEAVSLVDEFGMTPFHILFLTAEPSVERLEVLLDSLPNQLLRWKDANDKRPLVYLIKNWTDGNISLFQRTLQKWVLDRLVRWGAMSWKETMQSKVQELLVEDGKRRRVTLCDELCSLVEHFENAKSISILEMALWNWKLKSGWSNGSAKQQAVDREASRCLSGADVVIPPVVIFLGIPSRRTSF